MSVHFLFFFQAEDGIRDLTVTGVQTCALPISPVRPPAGILDGWRRGRGGSDLPGPSRQRRHRGCVHHLLPRRVLPVLRDVRGGGGPIVEPAGGPARAAAPLPAAPAVVFEHVLPS